MLCGGKTRLCRRITSCEGAPPHNYARHITADMWHATYPFSGHLFCFRGRKGDLLKVIWHDGQGACLFTKRLERGRFLWPSVADGTISISPAQFGYLLSGIDWRHPQKTWRPTSVG